MPPRIMQFLAIALIVMGIAAGSAVAEGPAQRDPDHGLIQAKDLMATRSVKTWYSEPIKGAVWVQVKTSRGAVTLHQVNSSKCSGTYAAVGAVVRVDLVDCSEKRANPIRVRYVSFTIKRPVEIFITRHSA